MDDGDLQDLFDVTTAISSHPISALSKPHYQPKTLPATIDEILKTWNQSSSSSRVGISPCDSVSLDGMFAHTWGEHHTEQPSRLTAIVEYVHKHLWLDAQRRWQCLSGRMVDDKEIQLVHSIRFLSDFLAVERGESVDDLVSMRTLSYANAHYCFESVGPIIARACRIAAGTALNLTTSVVRGDIECGFALIRPAGHHSSINQVGTFCGLNSVVMAAVYAVRCLNVSRVLILDWDVHRSGGTEDIIGNIPNEEQQHYCLIDIYAAFGKISNAKNLFSNCHLIDMYDKNQIPGDEAYLQTFELKILPIIREFTPSLILISAGFDAAQGEAEECARITPNGYAQLTRQLMQLKVPLVFLLEGGYREKCLLESVAATLEALLDLS